MKFEVAGSIITMILQDMGLAESIARIKKICCISLFTSKAYADS